MLDFTKELGSVASRQDPFWTKFYEAIARHGTMLAQWEKAVVDTVNLDAAYPTPTAEQKVIIVRPLVRVVDLYHHNVPLIVALYNEFKGALDGATAAFQAFLTDLNALRDEAVRSNGVLFIGPVWGPESTGGYVHFGMGVARGKRVASPEKQFAYRNLSHVFTGMQEGSPAGRTQVSVGMSADSVGRIYANDESNTSGSEHYVMPMLEGYRVLCWLAEYVKGEHPDYSAIDPQTLKLSGGANPVLPMARDWYHILRFMRETVNSYAGLSFPYVTNEEYDFLESLPDVL